MTWGMDIRNRRHHRWSQPIVSSGGGVWPVRSVHWGRRPVSLVRPTPGQESHRDHGPGSRHAHPPRRDNESDGGAGRGRILAEYPRYLCAIASPKIAMRRSGSNDTESELSNYRGRKTHIALDSLSGTDWWRTVWADRNRFDGVHTGHSLSGPRSIVFHEPMRLENDSRRLA